MDPVIQPGMLQNNCERDVFDVQQQADDILQASRERHKRLIETFPVGVFRMSGARDGRFLLANQHLVEMLGHTLAGDLCRISVCDIFKDPADFDSLYTQATCGGETTTSEALLNKTDGSSFLATVTMSVVENDSHEVAYFNGLVEDITQRKLLKTKLAQGQKLETIGQLAAGVAHEVNTPIQYVGDNTRFVQESIADLLSLFKQQGRLLNDANVSPEVLDAFNALAGEADLEYLSQEIPSAIQQSIEGIERITEIVRAMKEFAHPDYDEKVLADINQLIGSTVTLGRNEWKYVADVEMDLAPDLAAVPVFAGDFKQVILNLLVNAAHAIGDCSAAGDKGKGLITISTRRAGDWLEVCLGDTGGGIPQACRDKVFDLFFTTKPVGKGTGQGLAISRSIVVERHGGTITYETQTGKGTVFTIRIPIA
ncbi:MAG TPA: PAS domain S-box protein [Phycisphaerae bacterium]|nr:PAS domain S-box protein [Phycisphaerae bacterium]